MRQPIYLDNHATTQVDRRVRDAMLPWLGASFGNAGSRTHAYGWAAADAIASARAQVAALLACDVEDLVFTAGATEGCNLVIQGLCAPDALGAPGRIVVSSIEHHAVLDTCAAMRSRGVETIVVPVDSSGRVDPDDVRRATGDGALLVSVMAANNEIGTIQPIEEIGRIAAERAVPYHCDAAQAIGRMAVDVGQWGCGALTLSAHKFYGPQGVGALHVDATLRRRLAPLMHGGGQEKGLRPGTLAVPGIVALGAAAQACLDGAEDEIVRIRNLRDRLQGELLAALPGVRVNGHPTARLCGNLSVTFDAVDAEELMLAVPRLAISAGSACASGTTTTSHVLRAIGLSDAEASRTVRFGLGRFTTGEEVAEASELVIGAVRRLRA